MLIGFFPSTDVVSLGPGGKKRANLTQILKREFHFCKTSGKDSSAVAGSVSCHMNTNDCLFHYFTMEPLKKCFPQLCIMNILFF